MNVLPHLAKQDPDLFSVHEMCLNAFYIFITTYKICNLTPDTGGLHGQPEAQHPLLALILKSSLHFMSPTSHPRNWYRGESPHLVPALYTMPYSPKKVKRKPRKSEITKQRNLKKHLSENTKIYFFGGQINISYMFTRFSPLLSLK
jgi:hypothetical protein